MAKKLARAKAAQERDPAIHIRLPQEAVAELDEAALRNGRSRTEEVVARLSLALFRERANPQNVALLNFLTICASKVTHILLLAGEDHRGTALQMLSGFLSKTLESLGADPANEAAHMAGEFSGANIVHYARKAMALPPSVLSEEDRQLVHAARLLGLQPIEEAR